MFEVITPPRGETGNTKQVVKMNHKHCTCGKYNAYKYPCSHMIAVCEETGRSFLEYIDDVYRLEVYSRVWETCFEPMPHEAYWPELEIGPTWVTDPAHRREVKLGRPSTSIIHNEMDISRRRMTNHCGECHQPKHDRRTCPSRPRTNPRFR